VLFLGSSGGRCGFRMARALDSAGFAVNSASRSTLNERSLTWDDVKRYNVLVLVGLGESNADRSLTPFNRESVAVLNRFLAAGGGILVEGHFGQRETEIAPQEAFLNPLGLQPLWGEMPLAKTSVVATPWKIDFAYTEDIAEDEATSGVSSLWYPVPKKLVGAQHHTIPFKADDSWKVLIRGGEDSHTSLRIHGAHTAAKGPVAEDAPTWESRLPLAASRAVGPGRMVYFAISHEYLQGDYAHDVLEGIVTDRGIGRRRSDGQRFFENSLRWLASPSLPTTKLGGAKTDEELKRDPELIVYGKPYDWEQKQDFPQASFDMPGIIGARSAYSTGSGTPAEWVRKAKAANCRFLVFLEDFKALTPDSFEKLKAECTALSDDGFAAFPGFTIDDEVGNHYFYFGNTIPLPKAELIDAEKKVFRSYDPALGGHIPGQLGMTSLLYFTGTCIARLTGGNYMFSQDAAPFSDYFGNWNAIGVLTSFNGKLAEFANEDYRKISNSGQGPTPLALTFVDSPDKIDQIKWRTVYKSRSQEMTGLDTFFNRHKFYPENPCSSYITTGPSIDNWSYVGPRDYEGNSRGDFLWNNYRWQLNAKVSSPVGLKEVRVWNGTKLFRRFDPQGQKTLDFTLDLTHDQQHYLSLEAVDLNGGIAISRDHWDRNHRLEEFMCADRNNQLTYSLSIDSRARKVFAGNNGTLGSPYKRIWELAQAGAPNEVFRTVAGFDGGVSRGPKFYGKPQFRVTDGESPALPNVIESRRLLHSMDVAMGDGLYQNRFSDDIRVANVWHTVWKSEPSEAVDVHYRNQYFQLDPDQPIGAFIKTLTFTLKKDLPNQGLEFSGFMRPRSAKQYAIRSADHRFWSGAIAESGELPKTTVDFSPGAYAAMFDSPTGGCAAYPLSPGLSGKLQGKNTSPFFSMVLSPERTPQKAGESCQVKILYVGTPARNPHPLTDNSFFERFHHQFGLDGGPCGYQLDMQSGKVVSQCYILTIDGRDGHCFRGTLSGKLLARLPIAVTNLNDQWSTYLYDGAADRIRPLGMHEGTAWATVIVRGQDVFAGHPVTADNDELVIQVTQAGADSWSVEIHNPTAKAVDATVSLNPFFPPFKGKKALGRMTIPAGTSIQKKF
jgi:hypothetical protein